MNKDPEGVVHITCSLADNAYAGQVDFAAAAADEPVVKAQWTVCCHNQWQGSMWQACRRSLSLFWVVPVLCWPEDSSKGIGTARPINLFLLCICV